MDWLKKKARSFLGIDKIHADNLNLYLKVTDMDDRLGELEKAVADLTHRVAHLTSFFGQFPDDGEPLTKADLSNRGPWDAT